MTQVKNVVDAIDAFITGCKADGNWNAIKASCIMAGWSSISAALTPLKGAAPTNFNFVAGDYNRRTGLVGNGSTKYLNSNRNNNSDPQNNRHLSGYVTVANSGVFGSLLSVRGSNGEIGASRIELLPSNDPTYQLSNGVAGSAVSLGAGSPGFYGAVRVDSVNISARSSGLTLSGAQASTTPANNNYGVFARRSLSPQTLVDGYANARISFYSIGESVNLSLLESRVNTLMTSLAAAIPYDTDAAAYITAVEAADGQALEPAIKDAINAFVVACKSDGTWNAIKASCILAGARTLNGALVPLKGTAPTNFNFVAGDYNRRTGLLGNGATKYLDSNRDNAADPQNNKHMSINGTFNVSSSTYQAVMGSTYDPTGWSAFYIDNRSPSGFQPWINGANYPNGMVPIAQSGFMGATRSSSSTITARAGSTSYSRSIASLTPSAGDITVFNIIGDVGTTGRINFYSIGESLDIALLDARVTQLMNAISTAVLDDSDAMAYIAAVEAVDGQSLEPAVKSAINAFVVGCKSSGIWDAIKASCILAGARTLNGALVPLKGSAPTNFNFVAGDYDRKTGLVGDGSTKYLNSNRNNNADPQNNHHVSVRCTRDSSTNEQVLAGARTGGSDAGGRWLGFRRSAATPSNTANYASMSNTDTNQSGGVVSVGSTVFTGFSRSASSGYTSRVNDSNTSQTQTSTVAVSANLFISALNNGGTAAVHSDARITFYSIGESLDLALLDARVTQLMAALAAAIP